MFKATDQGEAKRTEEEFHKASKIKVQSTCFSVRSREGKEGDVHTHP